MKDEKFCFWLYLHDWDHKHHIIEIQTSLWQINS